MSDLTLSTPNSPNFNEKDWIASREALAFNNAPKRSIASLALSAKVAVMGAPRVNASAIRLQTLRNPVTAEKIEAAKVVNTETVTDTKAAELLGLSKLTVKALRGACKAKGFKGYSKLKKVDLLAMLG